MILAEEDLDVKYARVCLPEEEELFVTVVSLISWGWPTQAIVHTYEPL